MENEQEDEGSGAIFLESLHVIRDVLVDSAG